jgi:hypothetical protein
MPMDTCQIVIVIAAVLTTFLLLQSMMSCEKYAPNNSASFTVNDPKYVPVEPFVTFNQAYGEPDHTFTVQEAQYPQQYQQEHQQEHYMLTSSQETPELSSVPLKGSFESPESNPFVGFLQGGLTYGVSVPQGRNTNLTITQNSNPESISVFSTVI